jgi:hypothetical protein
MVSGADFHSSGKGAVDSRVIHRGVARVITFALVLGAAGCIGPGLEPPGDDDGAGRGGVGNMVSAPGFGPSGAAGSSSDSEPFGNAGGTPSTPGGDTGMTPATMQPAPMDSGDAVVDASDDDAGVDGPALCSGPRIGLLVLPAGAGGICAVPLPPQSGTMLDLSQIAIEMASPGSAPMPLVDARSAEGCMQIPAGFFYDAALPTAVMLCPEACNEAAGGASVSMVLGCQP